MLKNKLTRYISIHLLIFYILLTIIVLSLTNNWLLYIAFTVSYIASIVKYAFSFNLIANKFHQSTAKKNIITVVLLIYIIYFLLLGAIFLLASMINIDIFYGTAIGVLSMPFLIFFICITGGKTIKLIN